MTDLTDSVLANLLTEFIVVVAGVLFANLVQRRFKQWRYGRWQLHIYPGPNLSDTTKPTEQPKPLLERVLSADTAQRILHDQTELDVYLKGRVSPFANVKCDLITELESGQSPVIQMDRPNRRITIYARAPKITLHTANDKPTR